MKLSKQVFLSFFNSLKKLSVIFIIFTGCYMFWFDDFVRPYNAAKGETNFVWDLAGYYSYLPYTFVYGGSFDFKGDVPQWLSMTPEGKIYSKYPYGTALMFSPFFGIGYAMASIQGAKLNGFSTPFANAIRWGTVFYVIMGLLYLRRFLLYFFNEVVTAFTLFACLFGSMLYMYTFTQSELSHAYLFALFAAFMYYTLMWHQQQKWRYMIALACILGIISVTRFTEVYIIFFFLFWNVKSMTAIKEKFFFFLNNYKQLLLFPVIGFIFWIPQMIVWKRVTGHYFYYSYQNEGFFWTDPQILNILFSYRKGWITYTPIVVLAFIGFFFVKKDFPLSKYVFIFITALTVYVFSCWWDWNYGGCYGNRAFCQLISVLAVPMAFFLNYILYSTKKFAFKGITGLIVIAFIFSCALLTMSQSYQFQEQRKLHGWAMSEGVYWGIFRHYHYNKHYEDFDYWKQLDFPEHDNWFKGIGRNDIKKDKEKK